MGCGLVQKRAEHLCVGASEARWRVRHAGGAQKHLYSQAAPQNLGLRRGLGKRLGNAA